MDGWTSGVRTKGGRVAKCASDACRNVATWSFEHAGVGSVYCGDCKRKIEAQASRGEKQEQ
ncbi:MAG: hypothetical protein RL291_71 [Pseudomonadota bacterium]